MQSDDDKDENPPIALDLSGAIEFKSWDEIASLPGYTPDLDPKTAKLKTIIGWHTLRDTRCGLKDCHQLHDKGVIVETEDGRRTNLGHQCGEKYFKTTFRVLRNRLKQVITVRVRLEQISEMRSKREELLERVRELRNARHGADWLNKSLSNFQRSYPRTLLSRLIERAQKNDNVVTGARKRTDAEIEDMVAAHRGLKRDQVLYEDVIIGRLEGLEIFRSDIREVLILQLEQRLVAVGALDLESLKGAELRRWAEWCSRVDGLFLQAEELIAAGQLFFMPDNLKLLERLPIARDDKDHVGRVTWHYDAGTATIRAPKAKVLATDWWQK